MQRTERILIKPGHPNFGACHRLCGQTRRLGNCAVYTLRQRFFAKEPLLTRSELDKTIRSDNAEVYQSMPSAASAQRQTQIISEQMKSWLMASASYRKNPGKFKARPNLPGYKKRYRSFVVGGICQGTSKKLVRSLFIPEEPQQGLCPYASLPQDIFLT